MAAYAAPSDLILRYDSRVVCDLASDTNDPIEDADAATDTVLLAALTDGSGRVESACSVAGLYTPATLAGLTGNGQSLLKRLVCSLAMVFLIERRPEKYGGENLERAKKETEDFLDRLRKGERLFPLQAVEDAGKPQDIGPTAVDMQLANRITSRVHNFYPTAGSRLPVGSQGGMGGGALLGNRGF